MRLQAFALLTSLLATLGPAVAGPCTQQIAAAQASFDGRAKDIAAIGPTAAETTGAKLHRQPTAASVAGAEQQAGSMSMAKQQAFKDAIERARASDRTGDAAACQKDVAEAKATLGP